ncbi:hypothetical protein JCM21900_000468 [Sporobolomyces salmonicolor]
MASHRPDKHSAGTEYYQLAQYTCVYNARDAQVECKPFVRTFLKTGKNVTEVTPVVNRGGRLPLPDALKVPEPVSEPLVVTIGPSRPPPQEG